MSKIKYSEVAGSISVMPTGGEFDEKILDKMLAICDAVKGKREARNAGNEAFKILTSSLPSALAKKSKKHLRI